MKIKSKEINNVYINDTLKKAKKENIVFFKAFYSSPIAKALIDLSVNCYVEINKTFLKLFECRKKHIIMRPVGSLGVIIDDKKRKILLNKFYRKTHNTFNFDILTVKGNIKSILVTTEKIELLKNKYLLCSIIDITEKSEYEKKLSESEHKFGLVLQNTPNAIYEYNFKNTKYTYISPSVKSILGIPPEIFIKKRFNIITPLLNKEYRKKMREHYRLMKSSTGKRKRNFSFEYPYTQKKNEIWISDNQTVIYDKHGKAERVIGNISDITLKKTNEFLLKKSEEQYKYLFNRNPVPMWIFDFDTLKILSVNDAAVKHYGYSLKEFQSFKITDLRPKEEAERFLIYKNNVIKYNRQKKAYYAGLWIHRKKNGQLIDVEITRAPVNFQGKNAVLALINDVTDKQKAVERVKKKNEEVKLLYDFHKEVSSTLEPARIYDIVFKTVKKYFNCDSMSISAFDNRKKMISCLAFWQDNVKIDISTFPEFPLEPPGKGIQSRIIRSGKSRIINDYDIEVKKSQNIYYFNSNGKLVKNPPKDAEIIKSAVMVPLKLQSKVIGILSIFSYIPELYSEEDLAFLEALSSQVSTAAANALLYKKAQVELTERKTAEEKLLKLSNELSNLYSISKDLSNIVNVKNIFVKILKYINKILPECDAGISFFDPGKKTINLKVLLSNGKILENQEFPPVILNEKGNGMHSSVITGKRSVIINDYKEYLKSHKPQYYVNEDGSVTKETSSEFAIANATAIIPIILDDSVKGTIQLLNFGNSGFSEESIRIIETLASHLTASLTNAELYDKLQKELIERKNAEHALKAKTNELVILYEAQQVLLGTLNIDNIYDNTYRILSGLIPFDSMIISSYNENEKNFRILSVWADGVKPEIKDYPVIPLAPKGKGIQSRVIYSGKPLLIENYKDYYKSSVSRFSYTDNKVVKQTKILYNSAMAVPMIHLNKVIGVLQLLSYKKNVYDNNSLKLLESLSAPVTAATFNAQLYNRAQKEIVEKQKAKEELALRNDEITLLYSAGRELLSTLDLDEIYEAFYKKISEVIPCDSMIISGYDHKSQKITCKAAWVDKTKHNPADFPPLNLGPNFKGTQSEAIITKNSVIVNNFYEVIKQREDKYLIDDNGSITKPGENIELDEDEQITRSALYIPMKLEKEVIGVISSFSFRENAYSEYDLKIIESIALHLSVATANAELYKQAQIEINERIKKESEISQVRTYLEEAQRIAHIGSWVFDINDNRLYNSDELYRILGLKELPAYFEFNEGMKYIHNEDRETTISKLKTAINEKAYYENEDRIVRPNGEIRFVKIVGEQMYDNEGNHIGMHGTLQDITEFKKINDELTRSLSEKELILKEIHHRVKNNLQVVSSLLRLQSESITDETAIGYLKMSEQRVKSMALIHQQLYRTKDLSQIDFREYLEDLCNYLFFAYDISFSRVNLKIEVDRIFFGIDTALPCGLIVNELVTNSIKHAFPGYTVGSLIVSLKQSPDGKYSLMIKDDGKGAEKIDFEKTTTLGMELVKTLTEQLEGEITVNLDKGTEILITFFDQYSNS